MKIVFLILILLVTLSNCSDKENVKSVSVTKALNNDSLKKIEVINKEHWQIFNDLYAKLELDSFRIINDESYRLVFGHSWGYNPYGGSPCTITFHKTQDTCYVVIKDYDRHSQPERLSKRVKFIPVSNFDSIAKMFNSNRFWKHRRLTNECIALSSDPHKVIFEAIKNGNHKIVSQLHCFDTIPFLENWKYNFYHYSNYNEWFDKDWQWSKENPPCCIKTPGPPSELRK